MIRRTVALLVILLFSWAPHPVLANETAPGIEFFEKQVRPLLVEHCYECHSANSRHLKGGLRLDFKSGVLRGGDSGPALVPGKPDMSRLIDAVRYRNHDLQMPPRGRLQDSQIASLERWVRMGAPDPRLTEPSSQLPRDERSFAAERQHWSLQPVANPEIPQRPSTTNPVDAFVRARLAAAGLAPAPPADKRTLLRRATYDLTGLPPSPEELDAFLMDTATNAYEKVIDRLLDSPHYGVRWGRHWLDVARYADSNGLDENLAHGNAWRYRDYVVNSFNHDKPYDRFIVEQVAGDLLPDANQETKIATGFLALGAKVLAEKDMDKLVMDVIDEQIDTIGKAFMGMSLGCARCHDHKFDPFTQEDYYGLAAIFRSSTSFADGGRGAIKYWYEHDFATPEDRERIKAIEKQIAEKKKAATTFKSRATTALRDEARKQAVAYLIAATRFEAGASLETVAPVARSLNLHPRILHHCRLHLEYHREDAVFAPWHDFAGDTNAIANHYRALFAEAEAAWSDARKRDPKLKALAEPRLEAARSALHDNAGFLAVPTIPAHAFDADTLAEYDRLEAVAREFESRAPDLPSAMGITDAEVRETIPLHIRGSHVNLGRPIPREFPEVLRYSTVRPVLPTNQSGRLQFARWIADTRHPLTARVMVNRVWRWHFGRGLVATTENFGHLGTPPTHPQLLDWLAREFMKSGWRLKPLHRLIMTSATYRQATRHPETTAAEAIDQPNRLWWRFELRRLEAEEIRDSILAAAGLLDEALGGKTIPLRNRQFVFNHTSEDHTGYDERRRRALYLPVVRNHLCDLFQQFDYPDPATPTGSRNTTTVAPQALLLMNSPLVMNAAETLADRVMNGAPTAADRVALAYRTIYARQPTPAERQRALAFVGELTGEPPLINAAEIDEAADRAARRRAWTLFCQSLLAANEFIYLN